VVAEARSDETFVALCLLTVTGASLLTQKLGFSDTAGAFAAGVLLSETNFRSQVGVVQQLHIAWHSTSKLCSAVPDNRLRGAFDTHSDHLQS
jgi:NhaP-type Na+/H+ or K+/H+ antiporter